MTPNSSLSGSARRALRAAAHHLDPVVTIGQAGLTPAVLHEIDLALAAHALIKVRVNVADRAERENLLARVSDALRCAPVQHLGKLFVLWRNRDGDDPGDLLAFDAVTREPARGPRKALPTSRGSGGSAPRPRRREAEARTTAHAPFGEERSPRPGRAPRDRRGAVRPGARPPVEAGTARPAGAPSARARGFAGPNAPAPRSRWGERRPREDAASDGPPGGRRRPPAADQRDEFAGKPRGFAPRGGKGPSSRPAGTARTSSAASPKPRTRRRLG